MHNFNFYMPTKVLFGPGKLNELHSEQLPGKKALIAIGGKSVKKYGYLERLEKELDAANVKVSARILPISMSWRELKQSGKMTATL